MTDLDLNKKSEKNTVPGTNSCSESPSCLPSGLNASEAFALSNILERKEFEFQGQIQSIEQQPVQSNQDKKRWKLEQQILLLELHNEYGNKWTNIALKFPGKDHNCVKNHFYAQIRKSLRRLNYFIKRYLNADHKPLNMNHISKMVTLLSQKKQGTHFTEVKQEQVRDFKKYLFQMGNRQEGEKLNETEICQMKKNLSRISQFLDQVKKSNLINKQNKKNKKNAQNEENCSLHAERTIKISIKKEENMEQNYVQNIALTPPTQEFYVPQDPQGVYNNNFCVVYLYWNQSWMNSGIMNPALVSPGLVNPMYAYSQIGTAQQQLNYMAGNIFKNS